MLEDECLVGDYTSDGVKDREASAALRKDMVRLIEELHKEEQFSNPETLHQAVFIADQYMIKGIQDDCTAPCLVKLAATSLLISAKLHEVLNPSFKAMSLVLDQDFSIAITRRDLIEHELDVLRKLNYDLKTVSSIQFLERYLRLFNIDEVSLGN